MVKRIIAICMVVFLIAIPAMAQETVTIWEGQKQGVVTGVNATHSKTPEEEGELLAPLMQGTVCTVIGETENFYCLVDETYVYKESMTLTEEALEQVSIETVSVKENEIRNSVEIQFTMETPTFYEVSAQGGALQIQFFDAHYSGAVETEENSVIQGGQVVADGQFSFSIYPGAKVNGCYFVYENGMFIVGLKKMPQLTGEGLTGAKIAIDAGHGGEDGGTVGLSTQGQPIEKDVTLQIALEAQRYLQEQGAEVIMTRTEDETVPILDRVSKWIEEKPDLILSIHCNAEEASGDQRGFLTFYTYDLGNDAQTIINETVAEEMNLPMELPRKTNLAVSRVSVCPSLVLETGFFSNAQDHAWLLQPQTQKDYGIAIGKAAERYLLSTQTDGEISVFVNGEKLAFDQPPVIQQDRTLVPMRAIFEALGATVLWDESTQTVTAERNGVTVTLTIGSKIMYKNGQQITLEVEANLIGERTMVPLRAVAEGLGAEVNWIPQTNAAVITG